MMKGGWKQRPPEPVDATRGAHGLFQLFIRCHHTYDTLYDPQGSEVALLIRE
jgi:hypothetical protein